METTCGECEEQEGRLWCIQCEVSFCEGCSRLKHSKRSYRSHVVVTLKGPDEQRVKIRGLAQGCPLHLGEKQILFCETDRNTVCPLCVLIGKHQGHSCKEIEAVFDERRDELMAAVVPLQQIRLDHEAQVEKLVECVSKVRARADSQRSRLASEALTLEQVLRSWEKQMASIISKEESSKMAQLEIKRQETQSVVDRIKDVQQSVERSRLDLNHFEFLERFNSLLSSVRAASESSALEDMSALAASCTEEPMSTPITEEFRDVVKRYMSRVTGKAMDSGPGRPRTTSSPVSNDDAGKNGALAEVKMLREENKRLKALCAEASDVQELRKEVVDLQRWNRELKEQQRINQLQLAQLSNSKDPSSSASASASAALEAAGRQLSGSWRGVNGIRHFLIRYAAPDRVTFLERGPFDANAASSPPRVDNDAGVEEPMRPASQRAEERPSSSGSNSNLGKSSSSQGLPAASLLPTLTSASAEPSNPTDGSPPQRLARAHVIYDPAHLNSNINIFCSVENGPAFIFPSARMTLIHKLS